MLIYFAILIMKFFVAKKVFGLLKLAFVVWKPNGLCENVLGCNAEEHCFLIATLSEYVTLLDAHYCLWGQCSTGALECS